ncbi:MAG: hypothetical protein PVG08_12340 [Desulfobacterales bacterium]|jgi:hypothetical protein
MSLLIESRGCPSFKASKGEAVVSYRNPLATQKMGWHRLSRRVNKMGSRIDLYNSFIEELKIDFKIEILSVESER